MKKIYLLVEHLPLTFLVFIAYFYLDDVSYLVVLLIFFFGWLNDLDHFFDYLLYIYKFKKRLSFNDFFSGKYFKINKKIFIFLHSYEITIFLLILHFLYTNEDLVFIALSHFFHLMQDQYKNNVTKYSYFFSYRLFFNFSYNKICQKKIDY